MGVPGPAPVSSEGNIGGRVFADTFPSGARRRMMPYLGGDALAGWEGFLLPQIERQQARGE